MTSSAVGNRVSPSDREAAMHRARVQLRGLDQADDQPCRHDPGESAINPIAMHQSNIGPNAC